MKKINYIISTIVIFLLVASCKQTKIEQFNLNGIIQGKVYSVQDTTNVGEPQSDVLVSLENTELSATTDANGEFIITDVPTETYNLVYTNSLFDTTKQFGIQVIGGGEYPINISSVYIHEKSSTIATNLIVDYRNEEIKFLAEISPDANDENERGVIILISDNENVAYDNNLYYYDARTFDKNEISIKLTSNILDDNIPGFNPKKTYYAIAYGISTSHGRYFDTNKGSYVYTGINSMATNVVAFNIPTYIAINAYFSGDYNSAKNNY